MNLVPGAFRTRDVKVGRLVPISAGAVPRFLRRYQEVYGNLGAIDTVIAAGAAHHRLAWIHPFLDRNGRVARLLSHAMLLETLDTGAVWSIARGLARNVDAYKGHLPPRPNAPQRPGRPRQSRRTSRPSPTLPEDLYRPGGLHGGPDPARPAARAHPLWAEEEIRLGHLPPRSGAILEAVLYRGELPRGDAAGIVGAGDRQARRVVSGSPTGMSWYLKAPGRRASGSSGEPGLSMSGCSGPRVDRPRNLGDSPAMTTRRALVTCRP